MATTLNWKRQPAAPAVVRAPDTAQDARNWTAAISVAAVAILALAARLLHLDHPPFIDELNHVLAARSLLADGTLYITGDEPYRRARAFTYLVAGVFRVFGESLVAGRVPAVLAGTALVTLFFWWVRRHAGSLAAWTAALLLCFYPTSLFLSQIVRFYTLHALLFWIAVILVYEWTTSRPSPRRAAVYTATIIGCLALGAHLFPLTAVGAVGVALWAIPSQRRAIARWYRASARNRLLLGGGLLLALAWASWWAASGGLTWAWQLFNHADLWAARNRNNLLFYHSRFIEEYGSFWSVFPFLALIALYRRPRLALLCLSIFAVAFLFHSVAAWKSQRYIFYAMPAFFAVIGIALATVMSSFHRHAQDFVRARPGLRMPPALVTVVLVLLLAVSVRASFGNNESLRSAAQIIMGPGGARPTPYSQTDWAAIATQVRPFIDDGTVVVATANLQSIYYLNRFDYDLSALHLNDFSGLQPEFSIHHKTGRPVISEPESLDRVIGCHGRGVVLVEEPHWEGGVAVPEQTREFIAARLRRIPLPDRAGVLGFEWNDGGSHAADAVCPPVLP